MNESKVFRTRSNPGGGLVALVTMFGAKLEPMERLQYLYRLQYLKKQGVFLNCDDFLVCEGSKIVKLESLIICKSKKPDCAVICLSGAGYAIVQQGFDHMLYTLNKAQDHIAVAGFNYRRFADSEGKQEHWENNVNDLLAYVEYIHNLYNLPYDAIMIEGHSFGGAYAIVASALLHRAGKRVYCCADRTFDSLPTVAATFVRLPQSFLNALLKKTGWGAENISSFLLEIPKKYRIIFNSTDDKVVGSSNLVNAVSKSIEHEVIRELFLQKYTFSGDHICHLTSMINQEGVTADYYYACFIAVFVRACLVANGRNYTLAPPLTYEKIFDQDAFRAWLLEREKNLGPVEFSKAELPITDYRDTHQTSRSRLRLQRLLQIIACRSWDADGSNALIQCSWGQIKVPEPVLTIVKLIINALKMQGANWAANESLVLQILREQTMQKKSFWTSESNLNWYRLFLKEDYLEALLKAKEEYSSDSDDLIDNYNF